MTLPSLIILRLGYAVLILLIKVNKIYIYWCGNSVGQELSVYRCTQPRIRGRWTLTLSRCSSKRSAWTSSFNTFGSPRERHAAVPISQVGKLTHSTEERPARAHSWQWQSWDGAYTLAPEFTLSAAELQRTLNQWKPGNWLSFESCFGLMELKMYSLAFLS